jgi:hypothetical protein
MAAVAKNISVTFPMDNPNCPVRAHRAEEESMIRKLIRRRRARKEIILAAQLVETSYEPSLHLKYDPDDLEFLRRAVVKLASLEPPVRL